MPTKAVYGCFEGLMLDPVRVELVNPRVFALTGQEIEARQQQTLLLSDGAVVGLVDGSDGMTSIPTFPGPSKQLLQTRLAQLKIGMRP